MGIVKPWKGKIEYNGKDVTWFPPHKKVELGLNLTPEGRRLFPEMTVRENLKMGAYSKRAREKAPETLEIVFKLFPILKDRLEQKAGTLSGGQQQMLAIARTLMSRSEIMLLDEPSQGLAPKMAEDVITALNKLRDETALTILLVEQNVTVALEYADYGYVLEQGRVVFEGTKDKILESQEIMKAYLGL
jgi:branched-chain amino acid transport system ATP-binding protein